MVVRIKNRLFATNLVILMPKAFKLICILAFVLHFLSLYLNHMCWLLIMFKKMSKFC